MLRASVIGLIIFYVQSFGWASESTKVLLVSAETTGIFQTGGLAHAVGGLASALNQEGVKADIAMPFYLQMNTPANLEYSHQHIEVGLDYANGQPKSETDFFIVKSRGTGNGEILMFRHANNKQNYFDNRTNQGRKFYGPDATLGEGFATWSKAVSEYILKSNYDIVILNDWHSSLVALYLDMAKKEGHPTPKVVTAIHNLAFQGLYPESILEKVGIPREYFATEHGIEFYGQVNFLKSAIIYSDLVYTVSPQYAQEITTPLFGAGLDGLMRKTKAENRLSGILNGIENAKWDPANSYHEAIKWTFTEQDFSGKITGKAAIQEEFNLPIKPNTPIYILTSRVAEQKGYEFLPQAIDQFLQNNEAQFIIIGDGEDSYIEQIKGLQNKYSQKLRYQKFSERSEKILKAYGDFFINAAWFEPSGLNQMFALKNGTIPILSRVGGLSNSVQNDVSGFLFDIIWKEDHSGYDKNLTAQSLVLALEKSLKTFHENPTKIMLMRQVGMKLDNSWNSRVKNEFSDVFRNQLRVPLVLNSCQRVLLSGSN